MTKVILLFSFFILTGYSCFSQNILEALQLKNDSIGMYLEGEMMSTDTIIDLKNGYYEESAQYGEEEEKIIRQATIFKNLDNTITLGVSIVFWDFVCFDYTTSFYEISKDSIIEKSIYDILPNLEFIDFIDTTVIPVLNKYLPLFQENYEDPNFNLNSFLKEIYDFKYIMPQTGTNLTVTLATCNSFPFDISTEDWLIIENSIKTIKLKYDKVSKKFNNYPN